MQKILRHIWPDRISQDDLVDEMDRALRIPGTSNAWTMPIRNRVDMLTTGVRTPVGVKVLGADLNKIQEIGEQIEHALAQVPGTRSVYAERVSGGYFLDFDLQARPTGALRPDRGRRRGLHHVGAWAARTSPPPSRAASATP